MPLKHFDGSKQLLEKESGKSCLKLTAETAWYYSVAVSSNFNEILIYLCQHPFKESLP